MCTTSPFRISREDEEGLERNDAFRAVRERLRRQELGMDAPSFCAIHRHSCSGEEQATFRLHRDIIHTLLLPLFLLHSRASQIASSALPCSEKPTETERAFRGEARSAYSWLDCILTEERDWYLTERCPACIVLHVLHSEPTVRFIAVACLLANHLEDSEMINAKCRLPSFDFWLEALETAVREDPFWGDDFWPEIEYRAWALTDGVKQLVLQCLELRASMDRKGPGSQALCKANTHFALDSSRPQVQSLALKPSTFARKQLRMTREEQKRLFKAIVDYNMQLRWNERLNLRGAPQSRRRSITS